MGYSHSIYFDKYVKRLGMVVRDQFFETTADMVNLHVKGLKANKNVSNIRVIKKQVIKKQ